METGAADGGAVDSRAVDRNSREQHPFQGKALVQEQELMDIQRYLSMGECPTLDHTTLQ